MCQHDVHLGRLPIPRPLLLLPLLFVGLAHGQVRNAPLVGSIEGTDYLHASQVFMVRDAAGANISDSQGSVVFTYTMLGTITGWDEIAFVAPELSANHTPLEFIEAFLAGMSAERKYKRKKITLSIAASEEHVALGRQALYAKVAFPEYPGTGMTVFQGGGKQRDADFVGHFDVVAIRDLDLRQRDLPVEYLLVTSMRAAPMNGDDRTAHDAFLERVELPPPP